MADVRIPNTGVAAHRREIPFMSKQKPPTAFSESPDFVVSLARGLNIIKAFGVSGPDFDRQSKMRPSNALTLSDVAKRTGLARAVVRRFLYTLVELGYAITGGKNFLWPD